MTITATATATNDHHLLDYHQSSQSTSVQRERRHAAAAAATPSNIRPLDFYQFDSNLHQNNQTDHNRALQGSPGSATEMNVATEMLVRQNGTTTQQFSLLDHHDAPNTRADGNSSHLGSSSFALARDCLAQHGLITQSQGSAMPFPATSPTGGSTAGTLTVSNPSLVACNDSQFSLMNIMPEEINFSDIERVWLIKSWHEILLRVAFVAPIVMLGILGNATIIYSMCRFKPIRSKPTNIFILNMALADLLTTIVCPNAALLTDIYQFYVLGSFVCRTEGFIKITCLLVSAYSLIVLSFDWFLSVVRPCRTRISIRNSWFTLVSIWLISLIMASPLLFSRRLRERQWRDLTEVWCCELIQYTKFYWVCITFFLIYLPTFVMTIVLVVILAQMDRFEAKLRRSRLPNTSGLARSSTQSTTIIRSSSFSIALDGLNQASSQAASSITMQAANSVSAMASRTNSTRLSDSGKIAVSGTCPAHNNSSLSISMKYRRRIVKILFFYLLTSIVCWTPLQFTIIYRHFRSEAVPAGWFFELSFFSQLCASLSAAMNPIIFGFLSQPFRRIVVRSWLCRLLDKLWLNSNRKRPHQTQPQQARPPLQHQQQNNQALPQAPKNFAGEHTPKAAYPIRARNGSGVSLNQWSAVAPSNNAQQQSINICRTPTSGPKLTLEYIERQHLQNSNMRSPSVKRALIGGQLCHHTHQQRRPRSVHIDRQVDRTRQGRSPQRQCALAEHGRKRIPQSHSSTITSASKRELNDYLEPVGVDNLAYTKADEEDRFEQAADGEPPVVKLNGHRTTSFMTSNGSGRRRAGNLDDNSTGDVVS